MSEKPAPDTKPARRARFAVTAMLLVLIVAGLAAVARYGPLTPTGRRMIETMVSGQKAGRVGRLRIEGLRGDVWRDFTLARLTISDKHGVWLDARNLSAEWWAGGSICSRSPRG
jgi:translocation and assembly module TamB